jgi:ATP/maltotriose-dependent transcriptional regulator MalT/DNA-binding SARP family transcriptional activator
MFVHRMKLRPPQVLPSWIERPNVERRFTAGTSVMSIVAGPGYGKTVFAAQLFDAWDGPKLWYSLDATDADLAVFAAHVESMLRSLERMRKIEGETWRLGSPKEVGSLFAELLSDVKPAPLFVFDDVHVLEGSRAQAALSVLIERATRNGATFVLCGRSMPVALHAVAAAAQLSSAGPGELAFDEGESLSYLSRATGLGEDPIALDRLARRAEGWPAGLALVASTAASHRRDAGPELLSGRDEDTQRLLFDYLAEEVLGSLSPDERSFLVETSILDTLEISLCDAVTQRESARDLLPSLARRGLFISRRSEEAYTAHQLFREFLRHTLVRSMPREAVAILHRRAAAALSQRGDQPGAITHLLDAGDLDGAAVALEEGAGTMLASGMLARLEAFLQRIGRERVDVRPTLLIAQGQVERYRADWDKSLTSLERAIRISRDTGAYNALAEAIRFSASIMASRGEFPRLFELLDATLSLGDKLSEGSRTALSVTLGSVLLETERYDEALAVFNDIMPSVVARGDLSLQGQVLQNTAVAHIRRGDPYAGLAMLERALKVKRSASLRVSAMVTLGNLIFVLTELGDLDEAERLTKKFLEDAYDIGDSNMIASAHEKEGVIKFLRGDVGTASRAFREALRASDPGDVLLMPDIQHGLAQAVLALGNMAEADELCAKAIGLMRTAGRGRHVAPILLTRAACAIERHEFERGATLTFEAIALLDACLDAVMTASGKLDAAALLVRVAAALTGDESREIDRRAQEAATGAIALLHQRDYRFLLRTRARAFTDLQDHLRRWKIGQGLMPDAVRPPASMRIELLGGLRVFVGSDPLPPDAWKRRKARDIFAYLVSLRGRGVPRARLIDLYWPETDADAAHDNLRVTISAIRKAVGDVVKFESNGYRFVPLPNTIVDAELFDEHIESARQALASGAHDSVRHGFISAIDLYRGEFLEGIEDGGWQWRERERLRAACLEALRWLAADRGGDANLRRLALERLLDVAPFDINAVRMRLELMAAEMRHAEARRDYEEWKARYRATIGADPPEVWPATAPANASNHVRALLHQEV